ncbi:MAG TPA: helix-turn-helix transcriptional regulator, partial [Mycobacteriales bacterium]|nr:helix-turn-helix transcriptional regulator [Mycobacteriales bacterium]
MPPTLRPDLPIGDRIAVWRVHRGMTRQACAVSVGRSLSWWTNIETGVRRVDQPSDLALVAAALGVGDPDDLTGPLEFPLAADRPQHPVVAVLRSAMLRATSPTLDLDRSVADPPSRLAGAQRAFHSDRTPAASTGRLLRDLIPDAATRWRRAGTEPARRTDAMLLSRAYLLACRVLRHLSAYDLAATAADHATELARAAEDSVGLAWAMWQSSGV